MLVSLLTHIILRMVVSTVSLSSLKSLMCIQQAKTSGYLAIKSLFFMVCRFVNVVSYPSFKFRFSQKSIRR